VKGFLRAYARHVGLDENELVLRYEDYLQDPEDTRPGTMERWTKRRGPALWLLVVAAGIVLAALYVLWPTPAPPPAPEPDQPPLLEERPMASPEPPPPPREGIRAVPMPPPPTSHPGGSAPQGQRGDRRERDPWEVRLNGPARGRP
jgi:hypothetical protein